MRLLEYLRRAVDDGASDLFLVAGGPISYKLEGRIRPMEPEKAAPADTEALITELYALAGRSMDHYRETGDDDFAFARADLARFRVNAYRQRGSLAAVVRVVAFRVPDWQKLGIPEGVMDLAELRQRAAKATRHSTEKLTSSIPAPTGAALSRRLMALPSARPGGIPPQGRPSGTPPGPGPGPAGLPPAAG